MQIDQNHISFQSESQVKEILAPLAKATEIQYFSYGVNYPDTSGFTLITHADYYQSALKHEFPLCGFHLKGGWHTWNTTLPHEQKELSENLNIGHGIIFVNHQKDKTEIFEFATQVDNDNIFDFYMNNTNFLKKFMIYFNQQARELIEKAKNQTVKPLPSMVQNDRLDLKFSKASSCDLEDILDQSSYPVNLLSRREIQCFSYLIRGYSIPQISKEISLAVPTIANYICRIKQKLNCDSRQEMIQLAHKLALIEYFFTETH